MHVSRTANPRLYLICNPSTDEGSAARLGQCSGKLATKEIYIIFNYIEMLLILLKG
jgi:hypothetical protein